MTNIIIQEGQSIFDIVIQHYGSLDFLVQFCFDNKIGIDTDLTAGQVVVVDETIGVKSVKEFFKLNALSANNRQWKRYIMEYAPFQNVNTTAGRQPNLPTTAQVIYSDGSTGSANVTWYPYDYSTPGTFIVNGVAKDAANISIMVSVTLIVAEASDLDILRQIRDANPDSQLPTLWLDTEDPYTQWEGVTWGANNNVKKLNISGRSITNTQNINKLSHLQDLSANFNQIISIDLLGMYSLQYLTINNNQLTSLTLSNATALYYLDCRYNQIIALNLYNANNLIELVLNYNNLVGLPSLTAKGLITDYNFTHNNFPTAELNRLRALGFTDESKLLPQNP